MSHEARPDLSVIIPSYGRSAILASLLERLKHQTLSPSRFEVIAVDDGTPTPIELDPGHYDFHFELLRQENAGPGAARNRALTRCGADLVLILNDDAVPADDLLAVHLEAHAEAPPQTAVLGSFHFAPEVMGSPFVRVLEGSDLLFDFPRLNDGEFHDWTFFWTCNISLPRAALEEVGGFDAERFPEAIKEDVELGYRLERRGYRVLYRADARATHQHSIAPSAYLRRMVRLGVNNYRMWQKHRDPRVLNLRSHRDCEALLQGLQIQFESHRLAYARMETALDRLEQEYRDREIPDALLGRTRTLLRSLSMVPYARGVLMEANGIDPEDRVGEPPPTPGLVSVVLVSHDAIDRTRRCLRALRATRATAPEFEIVVVDNGSTDGSVEYLAAQSDVRLIRNTTNVGAPRARNQAIPGTRGDWIVFMDNDAIVSPGWLEQLLRHAWVDPKVGCICPVSDRAAHGQQITYEGGDDLDEIRRFAARRAQEFAGRGLYKPLFTSFCVLVRREVVDRIGGFDERFSPWGFEDDDFSLRAHLAGFRSRMAMDVFVRHEAYGGAKSERHAALLQENWRRFAEKWGGDDIPPYGEYRFLAQVLTRSWSESELRIPLPEDPGATPQRAVGTEAMGPPLPGAGPVGVASRIA